jgi:threonine/homoserine/homoserine lactone efflux protein
MDTRLLAFLGVATVITITPGPDLALVTRVVIGWGRAAGWRTSLGVVSGHLLWGVGSAIGVAALVSTSMVLYTLLRLVGGAYLIWLGMQVLVSRVPASRLLAHTGMTTTRTTPVPGLGARGARHALGPYRQGLVNDLLNPKIGAFYTTLLPQFIGPGQPVVLRSLLLAGIMALIVAIWLTIYVAVLAGAGGFDRRPSLQSAMERTIGVMLIGLGIHLWAFA